MHKILTAIGVLLAAAHGAAAQFPLPPSGPPMAAPLASPSPSPWPAALALALAVTLAPVCCPGAGPESAAIGAALPCPAACRETNTCRPGRPQRHRQPWRHRQFHGPGRRPAFGRSWIGVDYLMWWFKDAPVPVPLVTTSNAADGGVVGRPSTQVLFGNPAARSGLQSGVQLNLGHWFDDNETDRHRTHRASFSRPATSPTSPPHVQQSQPNPGRALHRSGQRAVGVHRLRHQSEQRLPGHRQHHGQFLDQPVGSRDQRHAQPDAHQQLPAQPARRRFATSACRKA